METEARTQKPKAKRGRRGVTLIEMLVVMTIIGLFVALVAPNMMRHADAAKVTKARADIHNFMTALATFKLDTGMYPTSDQGLQALRVSPGNAPQWAGPYVIQDIPKDPWGHDYLYKFPGDHGDEPDIVSLGQDGQPGGEAFATDIVSWKSH
jgi:general secretion pathway protein G